MLGIWPINHQNLIKPAALLYAVEDQLDDSIVFVRVLMDTDIVVTDAIWWFCRLLGILALISNILTWYTFFILLLNHLDRYTSFVSYGICLPLPDGGQREAKCHDVLQPNRHG